MGSWKKMDSLFSKIKLLEENNMNKKYTILEKEFNLFKINTIKSDQQLLANKVSISGIPYTKSENVEVIFKITADVLKIDIHSAYHTNPKDNNSKFIVQFNNNIDKKSFLNCVKALVVKKQLLNSTQMYKSFQNKIVYINHELISVFRKIFWLSKQLSKVYN